MPHKQSPEHVHVVDAVIAGASKTLRKKQTSLIPALARSAPLMRDVMRPTLRRIASAPHLGNQHKLHPVKHSTKETMKRLLKSATKLLLPKLVVQQQSPVIQQQQQQRLRHATLPARPMANNKPSNIPNNNSTSQTARYVDIFHQSKQETGGNLTLPKPLQAIQQGTDTVVIVRRRFATHNGTMKVQKQNQRQDHKSETPSNNGNHYLSQYLTQHDKPRLLPRQQHHQPTLHPLPEKRLLFTPLPPKPDLRAFQLPPITNAKADIDFTRYYAGYPNSAPATSTYLASRLDASKST